MHPEKLNRSALAKERVLFYLRRSIDADTDYLEHAQAKTDRNG